MTGIKTTLTPPQMTFWEISACDWMNSAADLKPRIVPRNPKASARRPISLIQAGAFQAAKNRATSMSVMMDMNTYPPSTKSWKILPDKGNMVQRFLRFDNGFGIPCCKGT